MMKAPTLPRVKTPTYNLLPGRFYAPTAPAVVAPNTDLLFNRALQARKAFLQRSQVTQVMDVGLNPLVQRRISEQYGIDDRAWRVATETIGSIAGTGLGAYKGGTLGASIGSALGPVGTGVGAVLGTVIGGISGYYTGKALGGLASPTGLISAGELIRNVLTDIQRRPVEGAISAVGMVAGAYVGARVPYLNRIGALRFLSTSYGGQLGSQGALALSDLVTGRDANDPNQQVGALSTLNVMGNFLDNISGASVVKSGLYALTSDEKDFMDTLNRTYGNHEEGFTQMDFSMIRENTGINLGFFGNAIIDFAGELLVDPSNWNTMARQSIEVSSKRTVSAQMELEQLNIRSRDISTLTDYEYAISIMNKKDFMAMSDFFLDKVMEEAKNNSLYSKITGKVSDKVFNEWKTRVINDGKLGSGNKWNIVARRVGSEKFDTLMREIFNNSYNRFLNGMSEVELKQFTDLQTKVNESETVKNTIDSDPKIVNKMETFSKAFYKDLTTKDITLMTEGFDKIKSRFSIIKRADDLDDSISKITTAILNPSLAVLRNLDKIKSFVGEHFKMDNDEFVEIKNLNGITSFRRRDNNFEQGVQQTHKIYSDLVKQDIEAQKVKQQKLSKLKETLKLDPATARYEFRMRRAQENYRKAVDNANSIKDSIYLVADNYMKAGTFENIDGDSIKLYKQRLQEIRHLNDTVSIREKEYLAQLITNYNFLEYKKTVAKELGILKANMDYVSEFTNSKIDYLRTQIKFNEVITPDNTPIQVILTANQQRVDWLSLHTDLSKEDIKILVDNDLSAMYLNPEMLKQYEKLDLNAQDVVKEMLVSDILYPIDIEVDNRVKRTPEYQKLKRQTLDQFNYFIDVIDKRLESPNLSQAQRQDLMRYKNELLNNRGYKLFLTDDYYIRDRIQETHASADITSQKMEQIKEEAIKTIQSVALEYEPQRSQRPSEIYEQELDEPETTETPQDTIPVVVAEPEGESPYSKVVSSFDSSIDDLNKIGIPTEDGLFEVAPAIKRTTTQSPIFDIIDSAEYDVWKLLQNLDKYYDDINNDRSVRPGYDPIEELKNAEIDVPMINGRYVTADEYAKMIYDETGVDLNTADINVIETYELEEWMKIDRKRYTLKEIAQSTDARILSVFQHYQAEYIAIKIRPSGKTKTNLQDMQKLFDKFKKNFNYMMTTQYMSSVLEAIDPSVQNVIADLDALFNQVDMDRLGTDPILSEFFRIGNDVDANSNYNKISRLISQTKHRQAMINHFQRIYDFTKGTQSSSETATRGKFFDALKAISKLGLFDLDAETEYKYMDPVQADLEIQKLISSNKYDVDMINEIYRYLLPMIDDVRQRGLGSEYSNFSNLTDSMTGEDTQLITKYLDEFLFKLEKYNNSEIPGDLIENTRSRIKRIRYDLRKHQRLTKNRNDFLRRHIFTNEYVNARSSDFIGGIDKDAIFTLRRNRNSSEIARQKAQFSEMLYSKTDKTVMSRQEFQSKGLTDEDKYILYDADNITGLAYEKNMNSAYREIADFLKLFDNNPNVVHFLNLYRKAFTGTLYNKQRTLGLYMYEKLKLSDSFDPESLEVFGYDTLMQMQLERLTTWEQDLGMTESPTGGPNAIGARSQNSNLSPDDVKAIIGLYYMAKEVDFDLSGKIDDTIESMKQTKSNNLSKFFTLDIYDLESMYTRPDGTSDYDAIFRHIKSDEDMRLIAIVKSNTERTKNAIDKIEPFDNPFNPDTEPLQFETFNNQMRLDAEQTDIFNRDNPQVREVIVNDAQELEMFLRQSKVDGELSVGLMSENAFLDAKKQTTSRYKLPAGLDYFYRNIMKVMKSEALVSLQFHWRNLFEIIQKNLHIGQGLGDVRLYMDTAKKSIELEHYWDTYQRTMYDFKNGILSDMDLKDFSRLSIYEDTIKSQRDYLRRTTKTETDEYTIRRSNETLDLINQAIRTKNPEVKLELIHQLYSNIGFDTFIRQVHTKGYDISFLASNYRDLNPNDLDVIAYKKLKKKFGNGVTDEMLQSQIQDILSQMKVVNDFHKSNAGSALSEMEIQEMRGYAPDLRWDEQMFNYLAFTNPISKKYMSIGNRMERVGRLQNYLMELELGRSHDRAVSDVISRHFNYDDRSSAETWATLFVPFISYPVRNGQFWTKQFSDAGTIRSLHALINAMWGSYEGEEDDYTNYAKMQGWVPIKNPLNGKTSLLKVGAPGLDALRLMENTGGEMYNRLNPMIRTATESLRHQTPYSESLAGSVPYFRRIGDMQRSISRYQAGTHTWYEAWAPGIFAPLYGNRSNNYAGNRYRNIYRNVYKDLYNNRGQARPTVYTNTYQQIKRMEYKTAQRRQSR